MLSKRALSLLKALFSENSNLQIPVGVVNEVIEIKNWVDRELEKLSKEDKAEE